MLQRQSPQLRPSHSFTMGLFKMQATCHSTSSKWTTTKLLRCLGKVLPFKRNKKLPFGIEETECASLDLTYKTLTEKDFMQSVEEFQCVKARLASPSDDSSQSPVHQDCTEARLTRWTEDLSSSLDIPVQETVAPSIQKKGITLPTGSFVAHWDFVRIDQKPVSYKKKGGEDVFKRNLIAEATLQVSISMFKLTCEVILNCSVLTDSLSYQLPESAALPFAGSLESSTPDQLNITEEQFQKQTLTAQRVGSSQTEETGDAYNCSLLPEPVGSSTERLGQQLSADVSSSDRSDDSLSSGTTSSQKQCASNRGKRARKKTNKRGQKKNRRKPKAVEAKPDAEAACTRTSCGHITQVPGGSADKSTRQAGGDKNSQERNGKQANNNVSNSCSGRQNGRGTCGGCGGAGGEEPPHDDGKKSVPSDKEGTDDKEKDKREQKRGKRMGQAKILQTDDNKMCFKRFLEDHQCCNGQPFPHTGFALQEFSPALGDQPLPTAEGHKRVNACSFPGVQRSQKTSPTLKKASSDRLKPDRNPEGGQNPCPNAGPTLPSNTKKRENVHTYPACHSLRGDDTSRPQPLRGIGISRNTNAQTVQVPLQAAHQGDKMAPARSYDDQAAGSSGRGSRLTPLERELYSFFVDNLIHAASLEADLEKKDELFAEIEELDRMCSQDHFHNDRDVGD